MNDFGKGGQSGAGPSSEPGARFPFRGFEEEMESDGYRLCEPLRGGGMSEVMLGVQLSTGDLVVLKSVPIHCPHAELSARLAREAESLRKVQHSDIVPFVEFRKIRNRPRLITRFIEGISLRDWMKQGPRLEAKFSMMQRIARAVSYAHNQGVAHRDLKPENILVRPDQTPVILDFGLAALLGAAGEAGPALTRSGLTAGTPEFMAPEQAAGRCLNPASADAYALGVIFFEMLTGHVPLPRQPGEVDAVYLQRRMSEKPARFPEAGRRLPRSQDLEAVCHRALARDPESRLTAEGLANELTRLMRREPVESRVPGAMERAVLELRRQPKVWISVITIMAGLIIGSLWISRMAKLERQARSQAETALAQSRRISAASDVVAAQEALAHGGPELAMPWVARALSFDPTNKAARFLAAQLLGDRRILTKVDEIVYDGGGELSLATFQQSPMGDVLLVDRKTRQLLRCEFKAEEPRLRLRPWLQDGGPGARNAAVARDRQGRRLALLKSNGSLSFLDAESGESHWELSGGWPDDKTYDHQVHVAASGEWVVQCAASSGQKDGERTHLRIIAAATGKVLRKDLSFPHYIPAHSIAVTHLSHLLVTGSAHSQWFGCTDLATGVTRDLTALWVKESNNAGSLIALEPVPGSDRVLLGGQFDGYRVLCADAKEGQLVWEQTGFGGKKSHRLAIGYLLLDQAREQFAGVSSEGEVLLGRVADGSIPSPLLLTGFKAHFLNYDEEGNLICSGDHYSSIWDGGTGEQLAVAAAPMMVPCGDGHFISKAGTSLGLWKLEKKGPAVIDIHLGNGATSFELDQAGQNLLAAGFEGEAQMWDLVDMTSEGAAIRHSIKAPSARTRPIRRPRLSRHSGRFVIWQSENELAIHTALAGPNRPLLTTRHQQQVECAAISPDGHWLIVALSDGSWEAWEVDKNLLAHRSLVLCRAPVEDAALDSPGIATCIEFSADGALLALGTKDWCTLSIWKVGSWEAVQPPLMAAHSITDLEFTGHLLWSADLLGQCRRLDNPPYHKLDRIPNLGLAAPVHDCDVSSSGRWYAAGMWEGTARVHDATTLRALPSRLVHAGEVTSVDWSPDEQRLLTGSTAGEVYIWDRTTGRRVFSWPQGNVAVLQAAFALADNLIIVARSDGRVRIRRLQASHEPALHLADQLEKASGFKLGPDGQLLPK